VCTTGYSVQYGQQFQDVNEKKMVRMWRFNTNQLILGEAGSPYEVLDSTKFRFEVGRYEKMLKVCIHGRFPCAISLYFFSHYKLGIFPLNAHGACTIRLLMAVVFAVS
jgi:hypothetical protein